MPERRFLRHPAGLVLALALAAPLGGCGPGREADLERQLEEARQQTAQAEADRKNAEAEAAKARSSNRDAALSAFYGGEGDASMEQDDADPADQAGAGGMAMQGGGPDTDLPPPGG